MIKGLPKLPELPKSIINRWPAAELDNLLAPAGLASLPIDHSVRPVAEVPGGARQAQKRLSRFIRERLSSYNQDRNEPNQAGSSELSPFLHFGHLSCHEFFRAIMGSQHWKVGDLCKPNGKVNGFWQVSDSAEALLDQLCTWREIGFNMCWRESNYAEFESLPQWAQQTMQDHEKDARPAVYTFEQFERAQTHDQLWNAAQRQLLQQGRIHNYLRMLWGKKILHWTKTPRRALEIMIELNNKYALDGRDPNSYSGIFWVLGRYDRAWGPEREVFGKIRYMTSENTARKHAVGEYLQRFSLIEDR
jgi:deoxyribodipyrimidine photo-lyase